MLNVQRPTSKSEKVALLLLLLLLIGFLERLHRLRLLDFRSALFASAACIVIPEIEHRLAEMLDDVRAVKMDVFDQCSAIFAVENDVFFFSRRTAPLDNHTDRVRRPARRMRNIWWNEECFAFFDDVIHDAVAFASAHLNVALELVKVLLRIDKMKIVPRVWPLDDHHEKIPAIVKITIAHRRLKFVGVFFNPVLQVNRRLHSGHGKERIWPRRKRQTGALARHRDCCVLQRLLVGSSYETTVTAVRTDFRVEVPSRRPHKYRLP
jgi:hypothetical protein